MPDPVYPMRINKYLAYKQYCTRREADMHIRNGKVELNGRIATLGDQVHEGDAVVVNFKTKRYKYVAYNKPRGKTTPENENGLFPIGRLDKDSHGLLFLTNDGRLTDRLLNPDFEHEKEYVVEVQEKLRPDFESKMSSGVDIGEYTTRPCEVHVLGESTFSIILTEGKKHQIRRMCEALGYTVVDLMRTRIMNIELGKLTSGSAREVSDIEVHSLFSELGLS